MKFLLDTHIFLWFINHDAHLRTDVGEAIRNPSNEVYLSVVSIWECVIKYQVGKLYFSESPESYLPRKRREHLIKSLVVDEGSIEYLVSLPSLHRDPFDRLLICQALQHDLNLITEDTAILA
jgi:PIN domain nuclease of toxin-antitoxin system